MEKNERTRFERIWKVVCEVIFIGITIYGLTQLKGMVEAIKEYNELTRIEIEKW